MFIWVVLSKLSNYRTLIIFSLKQKLVKKLKTFYVIGQIVDNSGFVGHVISIRIAWMSPNQTLFTSTGNRLDLAQMPNDRKTMDAF